MRPALSAMLRPALVLFVIMTLITGVAYPLAITAIAQLLFPRQANGSLIYRQGRAMGSQLIGQSFQDPGYFWSRPSATAPQPYNALGSGGSNDGPLSPALLEKVAARIQALRAADPNNRAAIPVDLVTASASGLDPDISLAAANYQVMRVARVRGLPSAAVQRLVDAHAQGRLFGLLGEPRVNVLELNLALESLK